MISPNKNKGFTLIEILVVISIIGMLSSVVLTTANKIRMNTRDSKRIYDISQIRNALEFFYIDNGYYPPAGCNGSLTPQSISAQSESWVPSYRYDWNGDAGIICPGNNIVNGLYYYLKTYLPDGIPTDPKDDNLYGYKYGNVYGNHYDLWAILENAENKNSCYNKVTKYYVNNTKTHCDPISIPPSDTRSKTYEISI